MERQIRNRVSHWARAAKSGGALVLVQLSHPGRQSPVAASWRRPRSCSAQSFRLGGVGPQLHRTPVTMTTQEVDDLIKAFGRAARIAVRSGFDGVQVHAAHGYCYRVPRRVERPKRCVWEPHESVGGRLSSLPRGDRSQPDAERQGQRLGLRRRS